MGLSQQPHPRPQVYEYATHAAVAAHPVSSSIPVRKFLVPVPRNLVGLGSRRLHRPPCLRRATGTCILSLDKVSTGPGDKAPGHFMTDVSFMTGHHPYRWYLDSVGDPDPHDLA